MYDQPLERRLPSGEDRRLNFRSISLRVAAISSLVGGLRHRLGSESSGMSARMRLLQVLPSVLRRFGSEVEMDVDFSVALRIYLENFDTVVVACPVT